MAAVMRRRWPVIVAGTLLALWILFLLVMAIYG